jgi:Ca2+-binding EF-hand superfamily protein
MRSSAQGGEVIRPSRTCRGHSIAVPACALNFDGSLALSADFFGVARLWSTSSGEEIAKFEGHDDAVLSCALSRKGEYAATAGNDGSVCVWHTATKSMKYRLRRPGRVRSAGCAFSPDGETIVASFIAGDRNDFSGDILVCSLDSKHSIHVKGWTLNDLVPFQVACTKDFVAMCVKSISGSFSVLVMDSCTGKYLREWPTVGPPYLSLSQAGDFLSIADDVKLAVCPVNGKNEVRFFKGYQGYGTHHLCSLSADGARLLASCADNSIGVWDVVTGALLTRLSGHGHRPLACSISGDGTAAVSCDLDTKLLVWALECLRPKIQDFDTSDVSSASLASDSTLNRHDNSSREGMEIASTKEGSTLWLARNTATKHIVGQQSLSSTHSSCKNDEPTRGEAKRSSQASVPERPSRFLKASENAHFWIEDCARAAFKLAIPRENTLTHWLAAHEIRLLFARVGLVCEFQESSVEEVLEAADTDEDERLAETEFESAVVFLSNEMPLKQESWMMESCRLSFQLALAKNGNKKSDSLSYGEAIGEVKNVLAKAGSPTTIPESDIEILFEHEDTNESERVNEAAFLKVMESVSGRIGASDSDVSIKNAWKCIFTNASGSLSEKITLRQAARIIGKTLSRGARDGTIKSRRDPVERSTVETSFSKHGCPSGALIDQDTFVTVAEGLRQSSEQEV